MINSENNNDNLLKIIGYLNGEGQTKYVDIKEIDKEIKQNEKFLKVDLKLIFPVQWLMMSIMFVLM